MTRHNVLETYYTPKELAALLKLSESKVREVFAGQPGVIVLSSKRVGRREYRTMRIPASAVERLRQ